MEKDKWVSFFLCLFFGAFGAHKFYEGRILLGIVYLLTLGFAGVGVVIDLFILLFKPNPYYP
jgi:TM2 domain-containing membrane protein YozV